MNSVIFSISLGEFTLAVLLHWDTFPTWIANVSQGNVLGAIALSVMALVGAWLVVLVVAIAPKSIRSESNQEATA